MKQSQVYGFRVGEQVKTSPDGESCIGVVEGEIVSIQEGDGCDTLYVLYDKDSTMKAAERHFIPPDDWRKRTKSQ